MSASTLTIPVAIIKVDGTEITDAHYDTLVRVAVRQSVRAPNSVEIVFDDPYLELFSGSTFAVGKALVVSIDFGGSPVEIFAGKVTGLGTRSDVSGKDVSFPEFVVEALDNTHALAMSATPQAYLSNASDVVSAIASAHGLSADVEGAPAASDYVLQASSDHAMLSELARRTGYEWFVEGSTLHFRKRSTGSGPTLSRSADTLLAFSASYRGTTAPSDVEVRGRNAETAEVHTGDGSAVLGGGTVELGTSASFVSTQFTKAKTAFGKTVVVGDPVTRDAEEATATAEGVARELVRAGLHATGLAPGNQEIKAGGWVTIEGMVTSIDGDYYVTEVEHRLSGEEGYVTSFSCGGHGVADAPWTPNTGGPTWASRGPVVGIVSNLNDPTNLGRVKVKFPSLGDIESEWARVASPGAGVDRGMDFRPEINDEVLVAFEHGDTRTPIVLGGLWHNNALPPETVVEDGSVNLRVIASRLGHKIELGDGEGAASFVRVSLANGTTLELSEETGAVLDVVAGDLEMKTAGGSVKLTESGDLTIEVNGKVTIKGNGDVKVESLGTTEVKGTSATKIDGGMSLEAKGVSGKVQADGILELKGAMVKVN